MRRSTDLRAGHSPQYALDGLHALPCGCVAAVYRTSLLDVEVISLEARGPHCVFWQHQAGRLLGLSPAEASR